MKALNVIALILVIVGALNWGLWGFFQFDFVAWLFGGNSNWIARIVYALVGISGLWSLGTLGKCCKAVCCSSSCDTENKG